MSGKSIGSLLLDCRTRFRSSGELNFPVKDAAACLMKVNKLYNPAALCVDQLDGLNIKSGLASQSLQIKY